MEYDKYKCSYIELINGLALYILGDLVISYFFYRSIIMFLILMPGFLLFFHFYKERLKVKRREELVNEFSELLYSVSIGMKSGKSIENAFIDSKDDMKMFFGEKSIILDELMRIENGLDLNKTLEELIDDLAFRSKEEDISLFSDVFKCAKRNGGNVTEVLSETADRIRKKVVVELEIKTIMSERRLEVRIMEAVPFFILTYINLTSEGYFDSLYDGFNGRLVMTGCLIVYILAVFFADYIMRIRV